MRRLESLQQLSGYEMARVRQTLLRRYRDGGDRSPLEISFGVAEKGGRVDPQRQEAICFYVQNKGDRRRHRRSVPEVEEVRLRRGDNYVLLRLPTDVLDAESARWETTAGRVRHLDGHASAAIGGLVCWKGETSRVSPFRYGALTVGHLFWSIRSLPDRPVPDQPVPDQPVPDQPVPDQPVSDQPVPEDQPRSRLQLTSLDRCADKVMGGRLLARTTARDGAGVDAALVELTLQELLRCAASPLPANPQSVPVRAASQLAHDVAKSGEANLGGHRVPFRVLRYFPKFTLIPRVGPIAHVLDVESPVPAFHPGTSGSQWRIDGDAACLQFAGWLHPTDPSRSYRRGLGQSMAAVLDWVGATLGRVADDSQDAASGEAGASYPRLIDPDVFHPLRVAAAPACRIKPGQEQGLV